MKKIVIAIVIITLGIVAFIVSRDKEANDDFNLVFRHGVGAKNELNTFKQTYTGDMVNKPSITVKMKLSDNELNSIRQKIDELDLFNELTLFNEALKKENEEIRKRGGMPLTVTPCSNFYLKVRTNGEEKEINWSNCSKISDKAIEFSQYMYQIIKSQKEYQKLPTPTAGYL